MGSRLDLVDVRNRLGLGLHSHLHQLQVSRQDSERVVQLMHDAAEHFGHEPHAIEFHQPFAHRLQLAFESFPLENLTMRPCEFECQSDVGGNVVQKGFVEIVNRTSPIQKFQYSYDVTA